MGTIPRPLGRIQTVRWVYIVRTLADQIRDLPAVDGNKILVQGLKPGHYAIEWWSPRTGEIIEKYETLAKDESLEIKVIDGISRDMGLKIKIAD